MSGPGALDRPTRRRREPEKGALYQVLAQHLETFLERARAAAPEGEAGLPWFVERELRAYLRCGILAYGFARVHCFDCGKDALVAFSCKGRGFCPSCGGRRMAETAAHLVDRVIPHVPVRQWVLTFPFPVRYLLAYDPALCSSVRRIFLRAVLGFLERRARRAGFPDARGGAVVHAQRFGSALNLNLHFHALVLDGVFVDHDGTPVFHEAPPLTDDDVARLTKTLHDRVLRHLRRAGRLYDPEHPEASQAVNAEPDEPLLAALAAASVEGRSALGSSLEPVQLEPPSEKTFVSGPLCAAHAGFTLQAHVRVAADRRDQLERLCRYIARPPIAHERLSLAPDGRVVLALRHPFRDGTTHILFDPLTFLERLAALIPRPRVHLFTYHGVLAPAAQWREQVIPEPPVEEETDDEREVRGPVGSPQDTARASRWAQLMKRVFEIDVLICEHCGGRREIVAFLTETRVVQKILGHLGLPTEPPVIAPARPPPELEPLFT